jgi:hypothetical protein
MERHTYTYHIYHIFSLFYTSFAIEPINNQYNILETSCILPLTCLTSVTDSENYFRWQDVIDSRKEHNATYRYRNNDIEPYKSKYFTK